MKSKEQHAAVERLKKFRERAISSHNETHVVVTASPQEEFLELFNELTKKREKTTEKLQKLDTTSLDIAGGVLSSFISLASMCGPFCAHALLATTTGSTFSPLQIGAFETKDDRIQHPTLGKDPLLIRPSRIHFSPVNTPGKTFHSPKKNATSLEDSLLVVSTSWINLLWDAFIPTPYTT